MVEKVDKIDTDLTADSGRLADLMLRFEKSRLDGAGVGHSSPLTASGPTYWRDTKSGLRVPVLSNQHRLADYTTGESKNVPSVGRFLRGITLGGRADDPRIRS